MRRESIFLMHIGTPLISIIIPYFNAEKYIEDLLESILVQTITDLEVIIVNDGSTPESTQILKSSIQKYQKLHIQLIEQVNQGAAKSRNAAIKFAKGTYITSIDADDMLCGRYSLEARIQFLEKNRKVAGVAGSIIEVDELGRYIFFRVNPVTTPNPQLFVQATSQTDDLLYFYCKNILENSQTTASTLFFYAGSTMLRRSVAEKYDLDSTFDTEEDIEWLMRFLQDHKISLQLAPYHVRRNHPEQYHFNTPIEVTQRVTEIARKHVEKWESTHRISQPTL